MKRFLLILLAGFLTIPVFSQSQGITYQAVILDKNAEEIPGKDIEGNVLPNQPLHVRFTILDSTGTIEYQEEHKTVTDAYGMINLVIGWGTPTSSSPITFSEIDWNGTPKDLKVDISIGDGDVFYMDFSYQALTFVPYAYHRNITATGTLIVDGSTNLKSRLTVTDGSPTFLTGNLTVDQFTNLKKNLTVDAGSNLNGQVTIKATMDSTSDSDESSYPLRVEGSKQGIMIKVNGSRDNSNNFVTFKDEQGMQGCIEGQTSGELLSDPEYIFDQVMFAMDIAIETANMVSAGMDIVEASTSSTACIGLVPCITTPDPKAIIIEIAKGVIQAANLAIAIANPIAYNVFKFTNIGVTYSSGSGDYAEWLPKEDPEQAFSPGEVVGIKGGYITRNTSDAELVLAISNKPIVLGNMPPEGKESAYDKVAFLGQVPVKVIGNVKIGDYIIPSGDNNGCASAVSADRITAEDFSKIIGIAWSASESPLVSYINVAVGLQANNTARLVVKQEEKIKAQETAISQLKEQLSQMNNVLAQLFPQYAAAMKTDTTKSSSEAVKGESSSTTASSTGDEGERVVVITDITEEQVTEGLTLAQQMLQDKGVDISSHPFFSKIQSDPVYKKQYIQDFMSAIKKKMDERYDDAVKSGAKVIRQ